MNICLNARDAMPDGGLLKIETEMITLDDSFCHFYPGVLAGTTSCYPSATLASA